MPLDLEKCRNQDLYQDAAGKLWRVLGYTVEPTVIMEEVEPAEPGNPARLDGGISGRMWDGFVRLVPEGVSACWPRRRT